MTFFSFVGMLTCGILTLGVLVALFSMAVNWVTRDDYTRLRNKQWDLEEAVAAIQAKLAAQSQPDYQVSKKDG